MNSSQPFSDLLLNMTRRELFKRSGVALGAAALEWLLAGSAGAAETEPGPMNPLAPKPPHFPARAKAVIYMHMVGAPSQIDLFEHKPALEKYDGKPCPEEFIMGKRFAFLRGHPNIAASRYSFKRHGQSGAEVSELLPRMASVADEFAVVKTVHTEEFNHAPAQLFLHAGFGRPGRPSLGAWVTYGLGSESQCLPAYVVLLSGPLGGAGTSLWSTGFLPSVYQGVQFRSGGDPVLFLSSPKGQKDRRRLIDTIAQLNQAQFAEVGDPEIATRINQYETAFRMQTSVPELMDISQESKATLETYGAQPGQTSFANNCLLARRLIERGVRMVQLYDADWDHHHDLVSLLPRKCKDVDQATAAPFTMLLAGGGVKQGITYGRTDEFGYNIVEKPVHVHDLNATMLHLLGLDHERLTYRYQGRAFRLTDVHGKVVDEIVG